MTREEAINNLNMISVAFVEPVTKEQRKLINDTFDIAIKALEQEPCGDAINRQATLAEFKRLYYDDKTVTRCAELVINSMPPVTTEQKIGHCKDCKWWKDSDGAFRRGIGAESQCPMNRIEVYEGNGYCYMFEPQERIE